MRMRTLDDQQRATLLDRLFRRISKLDDDSLLELDKLMHMAESGAQPILPAPAPTPKPAAPVQVVKPKTKPDPERLSRRYFLATLAAGSLLAAGAGGAAAVALSDDGVRQWLSEQGWLPTPTPVLPTVTAGPSPTLDSPAAPTMPAAARNQITGLQNQVATLQQQIASLTAERDNLRQQVKALGGQVNDANSQVSDLKAKNTTYQDVVGLYQQLESISIDQIISAALTSIGVPMLAINTVRDSLRTGVVLGVRTLQTVEDQMPLIAAGLDWLDKQVATLIAGVRAFQTALAVTSSNQTAKAVSDFISQVLDMLPFGAGQNIKAALQAMGDVLTNLPELLNNVSVMLIEPARAWIVPGKQGGLYDLLLRPVREQVLAPAQQMVANAENLNTVYNSQLAKPVQDALDQRAKVRAEITKKAGALPG
ncbi:MAG: hypothetical protein IT324_05665 [Anaerolineae bacterium]|nr:hypothetical protein [Anaerolineae bacterium]